MVGVEPVEREGFGRDVVVDAVLIHVHTLGERHGQRRPVTEDRRDLDAARRMKHGGERNPVTRIRASCGAKLNVAERIQMVLDVRGAQLVTSAAAGARGGR